MRHIFLCCAMLLVSAGLAGACSDTGETAVSSSAGSTSSGNNGDVPCTSDSDCKVGAYLLCAMIDDGACGPTKKQCVEYPPSCGEGTFTTVCGCDGKSHAKGPCPSADLGYQIDMRMGDCPPTAGTFWCGNGACTSGTQYCVEGNTSVDCMDLPADCMGAKANCACLMGLNMAGCGCTDEPGGGIRVNGCGI